MELRLVIELANAAEVDEHWRSHLSVGGAFVVGATAEQQQPCTVVLIACGGVPLELPAHAVYTSPEGVGVQLDDFGHDLRLRLQAWIAASAASAASAADAADDELDGETIRVQPALPTVRFASPQPVPVPKPVPKPLPVPVPVPVPDLSPADPDSDADSDPDSDAAASAAEDAAADRDPIARNVFERLRNLSVVEQLKCAREGEVHERMALERLYGKLVWEALLRNPRVTPHEVARIARMGALPRPLIELIVGNTAWLRVPEVRRALLSNLRLSAEAIPRVLRLLPKHELRVVPSQTAYPSAVREAARRLLKD